MKIKIRPTDTKYSKMIRSERPICELCKVRSSTQIHHYFSRNHENTRFDDLNIVSVCFKCHRVFHENPATGLQYMLKRLGGKDGFDALTYKANSYKGRDDKMDMIYLKLREKGGCNDRTRS